jgi:hypothetical protein
MRRIQGRCLAETIKGGYKEQSLRANGVFIFVVSQCIALAAGKARL